MDWDSWSKGLEEWEAWSSGLVARIGTAYDAGKAELTGHVTANAEAFRARVEAWFGVLAETRVNLDRAKALLPDPPTTPGQAAQVARYAQMEAVLQSLFDASLVDAHPAPAPNPTPEAGVGPVAVGLVVGGVFLSVAGIVWAVSQYETAVQLREQTAFFVQELEARVAASREGRVLPPTTVPPAPPSPEPGPRPVSPTGAVWLWGLGLLAAAGAGFFLLRRDG